MVSKRHPLLLLTVLATLVAAGCGGGSSSSSSTPATTPAASGGGGAAQTVKIDVASSGLAFDETSATAKAGTVTITSMNPQSIQHDIALKSSDGSVLGTGSLVSDGGVSKITVDVTPGTYTFFCSVPGHEEAGMKGTLTVS
jgi:plastocyanin